jgi:hypothetical protein
MSGNLIEMLRCRYCGCTEDNACLLKDGPCSWAFIEIPCCSNPKCVTQILSDPAIHVIQGEFIPFMGWLKL